MNQEVLLTVWGGTVVIGVATLHQPHTPEPRPPQTAVVNDIMCGRVFNGICVPILLYLLMTVWAPAVDPLMKVMHLWVSGSRTARRLSCRHWHLKARSTLVQTRLQWAFIITSNFGHTVWLSGGTPPPGKTQQSLWEDVVDTWWKNLFQLWRWTDKYFIDVEVKFYFTASQQAKHKAGRRPAELKLQHNKWEC